MRTNRLLAVTVLSVLGVTGLTACNADGDGDKANDAAPAASAPASAAASKPAAGGGLEKLTVEEILTKMRAANGKLTSVKATISVVDAESDVSGTVAADSSGNCTADLSIKDQGKFSILRTGGKTWLKPDAQFIKLVVPTANASVTNMIAGKWLTGGSMDSEAEGFGSFCDMPLEVLKSAGQDENGAPDNTGTKGEVKKVGGVDAIVLKVKDDEGSPMEAAVANEGEAYLLSVTSGDEGSMQFSDFNKPVKVSAPTADQIVDLDSLAGAAG
ncbi:hypothetical protein ACFC6L_28845 [Kitasatospora phosalacinea]|uniref:hypothetical protein n=1 Tax=Kitasatospora phosalacinea TaxID=2065 RepID=UPI0035DED5CE